MSSYIEERPWGKFEILSEGEKHKVKRITVNPGHRLSLQYHHNRTEHWTVVAGQGVVTRNDEVIPVNENQSIVIPQTARHRIENTGTEPLVFIEVQYGTYLGEDDIVRVADDYHRVPESGAGDR
jgi:mannose-6-phosphate isomerase-like protein (cupin superfamily)